MAGGGWSFALSDVKLVENTEMDCRKGWIRGKMHEM
jgi:hypothetical protein